MYSGLGSKMRLFGFLLTGVLFWSTAYAQEYKAVFDCSSSDADYIKSRMWLVGKTMDMIEAKGDKATFVITLHGGCVPMIASSYKDIVVDDEEAESLSVAQMRIKMLAEKRGVRVIACAMSLDANGIDKKEVLPFVSVSPNSFIDTIGYQNKGYALMSFK